MVTSLSHATIWVFNQEEAIEFYCGKLGFEIRMDNTMENGFRWVTVAPKTQPELELILMPVAENPMMDKETVEKLSELVSKGALGTGVFRVDDCHKTYEELKAKGVEFLSPPEDRFYGTEALIKDPFGNWFSLCEAKMGYGG